MSNQLPPPSRTAPVILSRGKIALSLLMQSVIAIVGGVLVYAAFKGKISATTEVPYTWDFAISTIFNFKAGAIIAVVLMLAWIPIGLACSKIQSSKVKTFIEQTLVGLFSFFAASKLWAFSTLLAFFHLAPKLVPFLSTSDISAWLIPIGPILAILFTYWFALITHRITK